MNWDTMKIITPIAACGVLFGLLFLWEKKEIDSSPPKYTASDTSKSITLHKDNNLLGDTLPSRGIDNNLAIRPVMSEMSNDIVNNVLLDNSDELSSNPPANSPKLVSSNNLVSEEVEKGPDNQQSKVQQAPSQPTYYYQSRPQRRGLLPRIFGR